jgi:DNA repair exonuclease SbcCD ATPase subunit
LTKMTNDYNSQKGRASALDKKIQKLNQVTSGTTDTSEEVDRLTSLLEDITKSNEEYKALMATYQDKSKFLSQQLLLSGQNVSTKQSQIEKLRQELKDTSSRQQVVVEDQKSETDEVSVLRTNLNEVQTKSTKWKVQANGMIVQLQDDLKEKNQSMAQMQEQLDESSKQPPPLEQPSSSGNEALEKEIADLKSVIEDAQTKAKERMKDKNQSLKELEDSVAKLSAEMIDLRRDKDQITKRLNEEIQRGKDVYQIHDRQLKETEDKLAKQNIADMRNLEAEMSATIHDLEREVKSLQDQANSPPPVVKVPTVQSTNMEYEKVKRMQEELRRSREVEVSLLNDNMKMKKRLDTLARETYSPPKPAKVFDDESTDRVKESVELPKYYKERQQRPAVIRVVKNTWNKLFRRKK